MNINKTAFEMGIEAAENNEDYDACPYLDLIEAEKWEDGYVSVIKRDLEIVEEFVFDKYDLGEYNGPQKEVN